MLSLGFYTIIEKYHKSSQSVVLDLTHANPLRNKSQKCCRFSRDVLCVHVCACVCLRVCVRARLFLFWNMFIVTYSRTGSEKEADATSHCKLAWNCNLLLQIWNSKSVESWLSVFIIRFIALWQLLCIFFHRCLQNAFTRLPRTVCILDTDTLTLYITVPQSTALQAGKPRIRFPMWSLRFFIGLILPALLWPEYQRYLPQIPLVLGP